MKYKCTFRLKKGYVVKIEEIPFEYLGGGMVGSNTFIQPYEEKETKGHKDKLVKSPKGR